jgi:hypothetical protein
LVNHAYSGSAGIGPVVTAYLLAAGRVLASTSNIGPIDPVAMRVRAFGDYRDFAPLEIESRIRSAAGTRAWATAREIACLVAERRSIGSVFALLVIGASLMDVASRLTAPAASTPVPRHARINERNDATPMRATNLRLG